jgi:hypothetical protein
MLILYSLQERQGESKLVLAEGTNVHVHRTIVCTVSVDDTHQDRASFFLQWDWLVCSQAVGGDEPTQSNHPRR